MKKIVQICFVLLCSVSMLQAETNDVSNTNTIDQTQTDPWVREIALRYNMAILARVYNNNVLFQPTGALLGIFKDNKCWGYAGIGNSPVGPIFNVTMGSNSASSTGYKYKLYDPATKLTYDILETIDFVDNTPVGQIQAPISIHISGLSAVQDTYETLFSVYPNPVVNEFSIKIGSESSKQASVELFNLAGCLVNQIYTGEVLENQVINVTKDDKCKSGIYLLKTKIGDKVKTKRLIFK